MARGEQVLQRMEQGGWRFKRRPTSPPVRADEMQHSLERLRRPAATQPIPSAPRTLLERVLQRDFAGVRVQMASLGALGVEAATLGKTVYLSPEAGRLDRPESVALLGHELTHVAARNQAPLQRRRADDAIDLPLAAPSLTRQLSQRLVQMSLPDEEAAADQVQNLVRRSVAGGRRPAKPSLQTRPLAAAQLAQHTVDGRRFTPTSALWQGDGSPLLPKESALPSAFAPREDVLTQMQSDGWRFKRRQGAAPMAEVQRAQETVQTLSAMRGADMPLPLVQRTLLERVLQRDFSGVRMQVAGLEPLGVEAAARGNRVYVQRETAANLSDPDNLALLGHELTHVVAAGHAPVQRSVPASVQPDAQSTAQNLATLRGPRTFLPELPTVQRSVASEERSADQVEAGIRRMMVQRSTQPRPSVELALAPLAQTRPSDIQLSTRPSSDPSIPRHSSPSTREPLKVQRAVAPLRRKVTPDRVLRAADDADGADSSSLSGVARAAMPVAQRYFTPVKRNGSGEPADENGFNASPSGTHSRLAGAAPGETITVTAARVQRAETDTQLNATLKSLEEQSEPDWGELAERIYPLIKDRLSVERDRMSQ